MNRCFLSFLASLLLLCGSPAASLQGAGGVERNAQPGDYVVLIHGLGWFRDTLKPTAAYFTEQGYKVVRFAYESRHQLQPEALCHGMDALVKAECQDPKRRIHFIGHSMGCIVTRCYLEHHRPENLGRVVLLTPPNTGTELADMVGKSELLQAIFGRGAPALGTGPDSLPNRLPAPDYAPGVIMGDRSFFLVTSMLLKGPDDGVIRVERGMIPGLGAFKVLHSNHIFLPGNKDALGEMSLYLRTGFFTRESAAPLASLR